ncbi:hypothetical protein [Amphibacillus sediminis]|uniref:hypothetical protein n=1 Tax=Amphibacillus sediminis TaxID=360185 RepID=UPI000836C5E5|nr:hypothetical protein [Amphibacillus sediminis]
MINKKFIACYILILTSLNSSYLGLELSKANIGKEWGDTEEISQEVFVQLKQLSEWAYFIEFLLLTIFVVVALWLIIKKQTKSLTVFISTNLVVGLLFVAISFLVSNLSKAPIGNLVQQLLGQSFITIILVIYQGCRIFQRRILKS